MKVVLVTNNPLVKQNLNINLFHEGKFEYIEGENYLDVLKRVRDLVHQGHKLMTHPLSGSIKPNETLYKSILLSYEPNKIDFESLNRIEAALEMSEKMLSDFKMKLYTEKLRNDFQLIDYSLIKSGLESVNQLY